MAGNGNDLGPCPFCGEHHPDTVLLCPNAEKLLPLEGRVLDGKFRFVRMLGEGGMGAVWKAENTLVKKTVAIKLMHVQFSKDEGVLARFRNEATAAGRIGSEHICDILDLGRSDLGPYIVMEMLRGRDLAGFLQQRQGNVVPGLTVLIIREALKGLAAAHKVGIIHRDLKPENIFLHEPKPGQLLVKLMDFGISKFTEGSEAGKTGMGVLMGTPEYMSPEQTEGAASVDLRTDIWAMGVIMYWALSGRNPFLGPTMAATLVNVSTREPPPLQALSGTLDPNLVAIIAKCLHKNPADRWASCDELSAALAPFENRNNGVYTVATDGSSPTGPGRTVASASTPTPPPGSTVASPSGIPMSPTGMPSPTGAPPSPTGSGASPTVVGGSPTGPGGGGQTWAPGFQGAAPSAPTVGGASSFSLSDDQLDRRPDSSLGGSSKTGMIVLIIVLLGILGGGGWFAYQKFGKGGTDTAAKVEEPAAADAGASATPAGGDAPGESGSAAVAGGTGGAAEASGGTPAGNDEAGAGSTSGAAAGETAAGESTGGVAPAGDDAAADTGAAADDGGSADDGGKTTGGGGNNRPPKPQLSKVQKSGSLYGTKRGRTARSHSAAKGVCSSLRSKKFANLRRWRLPNLSEVKRFTRSAGSGRYWLSDGRLYNTQTGNAGKALRLGGSGGSALCVSS
ncbi:MAG: protein kinase [Myxococcota bacterium]